MSRLFFRILRIRLLHWEYWNSRIVYAPLYPYWLWLSIKARSFFFLTAANPSIRNGGFIMERKTDVYKLLQQNTYPVTLAFGKGTPVEELLTAIKATGIRFPLITKPDIGERGLGVKKIESIPELEAYVQKIPVDFLIQEYIPYEHEAGIFYYRMPGSSRGNISGIVYKEPIVITGDGKHTVGELIQQTDRFLLQWKVLSVQHAAILNTILPKDERKVLMPYGNHSRGSLFTDVSFRINERLIQAIDDICSNIPGFYFGRLDIRFKDWESLERGEHLAIVELNGSGSEPTHIYDPGHTLFFAWKEIIRHWNILYRISIQNNRNGTRYISTREGTKEIKNFKNIDSLLSAQHW